MKFLTKAASLAVLALGLSATTALASPSCDEGEIVIKFSHVTNT
ncbi:MAG TPA: C4-dicarboxylate ABC transporter, partial [Aliiroseovarius sp.]|nr:C4-dicarboxylate ABC transporter [Aliiroseovarius sp.]